MSIKETKHELEAALKEGNRVISLSGKWGTGKTFMWTEIKNASSDEQVKTALEVSLFGVESISVLKSRLFLKLMPSVPQEKLVTLSFKSVAGMLNKITGLNLPSLNDLAEAGLSQVCKGRLIVLDDCERAGETLKIDQLFGFINELNQQHGCRFLLLQNAEQLKDRERWNELREKIIDRELILYTTPEEAFEIARVQGFTNQYDSQIGEAIKACEITNIRAICLIIRDVNRLLENHKSLSLEIQRRVIPSLVLFAGTHYKVVQCAPVNDCIDTWFDGKFAANLAAIHWGRPEPLKVENDLSRDPMLRKLGIYYFDSFEYACAKYFKAGSRDFQQIEACINRYQLDDKTIQADVASQTLIKQLEFDWKMDLHGKQQLARSMIKHCQFLSAGNVSYLAKRLSKYEGLVEIGESYVDTWVGAAIAANGTGYSLGISPNLAKIHQKILAWNANYRESFSNLNRVQNLFNQIDIGSTPNLNDLDKFTVQDFQTAMQNADWKRASVLFDWLFGIIRNSRSQIPSARTFEPIAEKINGAVRAIQENETGQFTGLSKILDKYSSEIAIEQAEGNSPDKDYKTSF
jgi:KAP family P-loop domain